MKSAKQRAHFVQWSELDRWVVPASRLFGLRTPKHWKKLRLRDVLTQIDDRIRVQPDESYDMAGVKWYGQGVFHRETVRGDGMSATYVTPLVPNSLIYNRLFAWKSSFAVVPNELSHCYVSNEFPQFRVDEEIADPRFVYLWSISTPTIHAIERASTGSAAVSRNRLQEQFFLNFEIALPPIPEQRAIVAAFDRSRDEVARLRAEADKLEAEAEADFLKALGLGLPVQTAPPKCFALRWSEIERWSVLFNQLALRSVELGDGNYPVAMLGDVTRVSYGLQKSPENRPGLHARPYLRVANVQRGNLDLTEIKYINVPDSAMPSFRLEPGDLLFVEGNGSPQELGRCAIWSGEIEDCVHQNHILKVRTERDRLLPEYAMAWFNTPCGKDHFFKNVKSSSGLGTINSTELRAAPLPLPSLDVQEKLVNLLGEASRRVDDLRQRAITAEQSASDQVEAMILGTRPVPK